MTEIYGVFWEIKKEGDRQAWHSGFDLILSNFTRYCDFTVIKR
jgi:hypothetical protein